MEWTTGTLMVAVLLAACSQQDDSVWDAAGGDAGTAGGEAADGAGGQGDGGGDDDDGGGDDDDDDDDSEDETGGGTKLDVGAPDGGFDGCGCDLSYIWVANSDEGTVSKIDTRTLVEEGRYTTRADAAGDPSRTSVNLAGDVAVANRRGGLVKIYAEASDCTDYDGDGEIQTSTGKDDVLAWGEEECVAWYVDIPTTNQRPVAWTGGTAGPDACDADDADVWTIGSAMPGLVPGLGGPGGIVAYLIDGETGALEETVAVPTFNGDQFGAYGGAVDKFGNLWFTSMGFGGGQLGRIDADTLSPEIFTIPPEIGPYGITVDHVGRPWVSSLLTNGAGRFDPETQTWDVVPGFFSGSGITEDPNGEFMWVAAGNAVHAVDLESLAPGPVWETTEHVKGLGFDGDGFLWAVTWTDPRIPNSDAPAYKIDTDTMQVEGVYVGLTYPYTYSDMTGSALGNVTCPPAG